jgi:ABC-2 type transport system permease protein
MWYQIFKFELQYRKKRPATYIYFGILMLMCFLAVSTDVVTMGGAVGQIKENSPYLLTNMLLIISAFFTMITSAVMGVAVVRDFEHKTESLMFSTPIKKRDYLLGRFLGSFVTVAFVFSGSILGFMLGDVMPWRDAEKLLPFSLWHYVQPFLLFVLPNLFISGALFFAIGALSRRMLVVYTQGIFMLVFYQVALSFVKDLDGKEIAALIDPFGLIAMDVATEY